MRIGLLGATVLLGGGLTLGAAATFVNAQSGDPNMARNAVHYGVGQMAGMAGEGANVVPAVIEQVRPAFTRTMGQASSVLGSTTPTPTTRTDQVDPADQGGQP